MSRTTWSALASRSSAVWPATSTPRRNSAPTVTTCTAGTAMARPQGQVMMSAATAGTSAACQGRPANSHQPRKVPSAIRCAAGTYRRAARSAMET